MQELTPPTRFMIAGWSDYPEDARDIVLGHLHRSAVKSRDEDGCIEFFVSADPDNPERIVTLEIWENKAAHAVHLESEHVQEFKEAAAPYQSLRRSLHYYDAVMLGQVARRQS